MPTNTNVSNLKELLGNAQLPALPQSAIRLLELSQDSNNGPNEFAIPIEADPGLAGQVLRFVNSSYFGFSREISSVRLAINLVGIRTIKNFALWSAVFSLIPNPKCGPFDLKALWQDSLRRGLFARAFGKAVGLKDAEDLFTAALLQDMAIPLLAKELADEYLEMFQSQSETPNRLSVLEKERFGWSHADAGAELCKSWSFPEEFSALVLRHADADVFEDSNEISSLSVSLSSLLPSAHADTWHEREEFTKRFYGVKGAEKLLPEELLQQTDEEFEEFAPVLKLAVPAKTLVKFFQEDEVNA